MNQPTHTKQAPTILVVDDEDWNLMLVEAILEDYDYRVLMAKSGAEALEMVAEELPDAILLDIMMPEMDGFEVCRRLKTSRRTFFVPIVMLTALSDRESKIRGLDAGADEFLNKPINRIELTTRLRSLLRIGSLRHQLDSADSIMVSMVAALEGKQARTRDHSLRVAALAAAAGRRLGLQGAELEGVVWGALLHDIGKIGVPDDVLEQSAGERSPDAMRFYKFHPLYSERLLEPLGSLAAARSIVRHHHERLDGSGYPDGLKGDAFTRSIEVVAVANEYDLHRMAGRTAEQRAEELRTDARFGKFRPEVVEALLEAAAEQPSTPPDFADLLPVPSIPAHGHLFIADDSESNREIYREHLSEVGYEVETFPDGAALLAAVQKREADLLLVDVRMPELGGEDVCRRLKTDPRYEALPIILVTAHEDATGKERALASGADDLLTLPLDRQELLARVRSLLRLKTYRLDLEEHESVVLSLSGMLETKDPYTNGHSSRVGLLTERLAREMEQPAELVNRMKTAGLVHDIGKVAVPEHILHKRGELNDEEWAVVATHPVVGWEICKGLRSLEPMLPCVRNHHERFDGSGYPDGLTGQEIPIGARLMGMADAFDALTSERPYRERLTVEKTFEILREETAEGKWDPEVFRALERLRDRGEL